MNDKPSRPPGAFLSWLNHERANLREANAELSSVQLNKKAGKIWKNLPYADKAIWLRKSTDDMKKYQRAMKAYKARIESVNKTTNTTETPIQETQTEQEVPQSEQEVPQSEQEAPQSEQEVPQEQQPQTEQSPAQEATQERSMCNIS